MAYPARHKERKAARAGISLLLLCVILFAAPSNQLWAQHPVDALKTFTAPDGAFSLRYSSELVRCQQKKQPDGGHSWIPTENCAAYFPVCDDQVAQESTAVACFAYPRNKFTNSDVFEAATFSVETMDPITTEK